jgi:hypothetical protein
MSFLWPIFANRITRVSSFLIVKKWTVFVTTEDIALESARIQRELGLVPQHDLKKEWRETIREMRERGVL